MLSSSWRPSSGYWLRVWAPTRVLRRAVVCTLSALGIATDYFDPKDETCFKRLLRSATRLVHLESPASGTLEMVQVDKICEYVKARSSECVVSMDNSWATPLAFKPLTCGVDVSVNALTKYPCGGSDVVMGSVSANARVAATLMKYHSWFGMCVGDQESYVVLKGLKTAKARLSFHYGSAVEVASFLETVASVDEVFYPAVPSSPYYELWKLSYKLAGGVLSFSLRGDCDKAKRFLNKLKVFGLGWSWGGYKSLASVVDVSGRRYPPLGGHVIVRLQLGMEETDDLIWDLDQAFKAL
ncbi:MAG: PLP-dependent transferase [Candidatus Hodgkinia cicadicola]